MRPVIDGRYHHSIERLEASHLCIHQIRWINVLAQAPGKLAKLSGNEVVNKKIIRRTITVHIKSHVGTTAREHHPANFSLWKRRNFDRDLAFSRVPSFFFFSIIDFRNSYHKAAILVDSCNPKTTIL